MPHMRVVATLLVIAAVSADAQTPVAVAPGDADQMVRVRVLDQAGHPVTGASVWAALWNRGTTDLDGVGELRGLPRQRMVVSAAHANFSGPLGRSGATAVVVPGAGPEAVDLVLFERGAINGWIADAEQRPVAGAGVVAIPVHPGRRPPPAGVASPQHKHQ